MPKEKPIGKIIHFFDKISVAVIKLKSKLKIGDNIKIVNKDESEFTQVVDSIQVEHKEIQEAKSGDDVGMKVAEAVKQGAKVYLVHK